MSLYPSVDARFSNDNTFGMQVLEVATFTPAHPDNPFELYEIGTRFQPNTNSALVYISGLRIMEQEEVGTPEILAFEEGHARGFEFFVGADLLLRILEAKRGTNPHLPISNSESLRRFKALYNNPMFQEGLPQLDAAIDRASDFFHDRIPAQYLLTSYVDAAITGEATRVGFYEGVADGLQAVRFTEEERLFASIELD